LKFYIGYDIGAISVNRAVINENKKIISVMPYTRHYGEPVKIILDDIEKLAEGNFTGSLQNINSGSSIIKEKPDENYLANIAFTGSGGKNLSALLGLPFINEIEAITAAVQELLPEIKSVIEIGGQDSKFISIASGDYAMNELCAAGTGSFLDQQASRFNLTIEEFADLAMKSLKPATIAGRCSVFAKSDMIHLQQEAASDEDIALGLCFAVARSFKSCIAKGREFVQPVLFCGGVSFNRAMARAFEEVLGSRIQIPDHRESFGAIGAALSSAGHLNYAGAVQENKLRDRIDHAEMVNILKNHLKDFVYRQDTLKPLLIEKSLLPSEKSQVYVFNEKAAGKKTDAYIGIDVGSISTNVVAIDADKKLIHKVYLRTSGRPIEAVRKGIEIIGDAVGDKINVKAVGTTGSGRYLIGDLVGADTIINEITAQATAAADIDPEVDTIFEIGGQDSKYISLENGVVVDFEMNKICAAGTGSFLEEQSERFNIRIEDFGQKALAASAPLNLGERCTVFMETNVYSHYQKGAYIEDILAGLAYSIAINYINRVVARKKIGSRIFFQGAVAFNKSVVAAFENYLGKKIIVPENHEVTGAIGTAIRALENCPQVSKFRGFNEIKNIKYLQSSFECNGCPNNCEIKKVSIDNTKPLFYGGRCEKYEKKKQTGEKLADLFLLRDEILLNSYELSKTGHAPAVNLNDTSGEKAENKFAVKPLKTSIGIPFTMLNYEFLPFWKAFFTELGFEVVLSDKTNKKIINEGLACTVAETCFPMKVVLGHVHNLLEKGAEYIFVPGIRDMPCPENRIEGSRTGSYPCPFIQGISSFVKASVKIDEKRILDPLINFSYREYLKNEQLQKLGKRLGCSKPAIKKAVTAAYKAQEYFYRTVSTKGKEVIQKLGENEVAAVVISRPYNSCDANISMDIPGKLRDIGIQAIPLDFLPLEEVDLFNDWPNMYWEFGDRILSAVEIIKKDKRLYPVYITNFGCGPDSFILQYFERTIDRPFLKIEVDEHTAGAGVITRCEAFYDSLNNIKKLHKKVKTEDFTYKLKDPEFKKSERRKIYVPYMGDGAYAIEAAFKSAGIEAEVMHSDSETLELGRKYTLGKECYPYIVTTGDILKTLKHNDPKKCAFLMPLTHGPCRFGQYNKMQKILLKELGYGDVPVVAPGAPESRQFYKEYDMQGSKGSELLLNALIGIFTIDNLNKFLRKIRPHELQKGQTWEVYSRLLKKAIQTVENSGSRKELSDRLKSILAEAAREFKKIPVDGLERPRIGIVGEIYVRNHPFSNNETIKKVEELGGEVEIPDFSEWAYHTNATSKLDITIKQKDILYKIFQSFNFPANVYNGNGAVFSKNSSFVMDGKSTLRDISRLAPNFIKGAKFYASNRIFKKVLNAYLSRLKKPLEGWDHLEADETDIYEIWDNAEPFIIKWFGEAALSVGKSIDWIKKDIDGIINVLPFTCMPGTMVTAISKRIREQYGVPWLNIAFDGLEQGTTETRLEAFMFQARQYMKNKKSKTAGV